MNPTVLDPCCGSRMMWFDKQDQRVLFGDQRTESHVLSDGRALEIKPDVKLDFTNLPPKVKEILEKLSESGAKVEVMKVEVLKS